MNAADNNARIDRLEIMLSEQEYTIETLNSVITRQSRDILELTQQLDLLRLQIKELKKQVPQAPIIDEKPPHY
ncbi:MAG: SlyX family protein [Gammaproteobacteria bacterium]|nr:SlyX family protein [Gammaproteobacteria bacterium]